MPVLPAHTNYIKHLNSFFAKVWTDDRLNSNHISLYMALFQIWNQYRFSSPFPIIREEVMRLSRIKSKDTYVKCLRQLHDRAYIVYQPSGQMFAPSLVSIIPLNIILSEEESQQLFLFSPQHYEPEKLEKLAEIRQAIGPKIMPHMWPKIMPGQGPKNIPDTGLKLGLFNKQINNNKHEGENRLPPSKKNKDETGKKNDLPHKDAPRAENSKEDQRELPTLSQVQDFFNSHKYAPLEGDKFFHHYQANGWRQGGQTLILDWQSAAHKWMLNIHAQTQTNHDKHTKSTHGAGRLHSNENKNYSDPL
ncbi:hypothetical protein DVR12_20355 [Chitinophaga silvatica]|uniref:Uncharacterized protein n=1 Tax=Chitinophaga silvatica TaxID=2282649 RepID=A0A3E1Y5R3_9BACT|nr:hypothetical protein [Chitinophaga silvatica]RFS20074.1 hypothetical protein DVR12_20355 [Chitinophaga silvatica]